MRLFVNKFPFIYEYQKAKRILYKTQFGIKCRLRNERENINRFFDFFSKILFYFTNLPYNHPPLWIVFAKIKLTHYVCVEQIILFQLI